MPLVDLFHNYVCYEHRVANPAPGVQFTLDCSDAVWTSVADLPLELAQKQLVAHAKEINGLEAEIKKMKDNKRGTTPAMIQAFKDRQEYMLTFLFPLVIQRHSAFESTVDLGGTHFSD